MNSFRASAYLGSFMCSSISLQTSLKSFPFDCVFMLMRNDKLLYKIFEKTPKKQFTHLQPKCKSPNTLSIINPIDPATKIPASCVCPTTGMWQIVNGDDCNLDTICDIGNNVVRILDGALRIVSGGQLRAGGFSFEENQNFAIEEGGPGSE